MANTVIDTIMARRSYKMFDGRDIPAEQLEAIIEAGKRAPSAMNRQPWHITVVKDAEMLDKIYQALCKTPGPGGRVMEQTKEQALRNAPVLIFVSSEDGNTFDEGNAGLEAGLVTENMLVAAASYGIMGGWAHVFVLDFFKNEAGAVLKSQLIPDGYTVRSAIFYGYPEGTKPDRELRENTVTII